MSQNIPVKFVRADGETIQLPITSVTLDVDRSFLASMWIYGETRDPQPLEEEE